MIENSPIIKKRTTSTTINNNNTTTTQPTCNPCCCNSNKNNNGDLVDIEESSNSLSNSNNNIKNNNNNNGDRKIIIEQKVSKDQPLSECLNNISSSLQYLSNEQLPMAKQLLESINNGNGTRAALVCVCQQSSNLPFCDSSHEKFNKETNSNIQPIYLSLDNGNHDNNSSNSNIKKQPQVKKIIDQTKNKPIILKEEKEPKQQQLQQPQQQLQQTKPIIQLKFKPGKLNDPINCSNYISLEEISTHNNIDSCWMIIQNKVYDITTYIPKHPGGKNALLRFAGKDGSENVQFHSAKMLQILNDTYFIGHLQKDQQVVEPSRCTLI